jgi:hypothetical protein
MYIRTECVHCGGVNVHDVEVNYQKITEIIRKQVYTKVIFKSVTVKETLTEDTLIDHILKTLQENHKLNVNKKELIKILDTVFTVSEGSANEIAKEVIRQKTAKKRVKSKCQKKVA